MALDLFLAGDFNLLKDNFEYISDITFLNEAKVFN